MLDSGIIEYKGFRITISEESGRFVAWTKALDHSQIISGYTFAESVSTHYYDNADAALSAAKAAIDSGEVSAHRKT